MEIIIERKNVDKEHSLLSLEINDDDDEDLVKKGIFHYNEKDYISAIECFKKVLEIGNSNVEVTSDILYYLGEIYYFRTKDNIKIGYEFYLKSAERGNSLALYRLALIYHYGSGSGNTYEIKPDIKLAIEYYQKVIDKGNHSNALYNLAMIYHHGRGPIESNINLSIDYYKKSGDLNNSNALYELGYIYQFGNTDIIKPDIKLSLDYYTKSARLGNPKAYHNKANIYYLGKEIKLAKKNYQKAAELGFASSFHSLGNIYMDSFNNINKAIEYYKLSSDLERNNINSLCRLGQIYFKGNKEGGVSQDMNLAIEYFHRVSEIGHLKISKLLGQLYRDGVDGIVKKDTSKSIDYYKKSSDLGDMDSIAYIGSVYLNGRDEIRPNSTLAIEYYKKAVTISIETTSFSNLGLYYYNLGLIYEKEGDINLAIENYENSTRNGYSKGYNALGLIYQNQRKDFKLAIENYEKSVKMNCSEGLYNLGILYLYGSSDNEIKMDVKKAVEYIKRGADNYHTDSLVKLGDIYWNEGKGIIKQDLSRSIDYYKKANSSNSFFNIGMIYYSQILRNLGKSIKYFKKSADKGHSNAMFTLGHIYHKVKPDITKSIEFYQKSMITDNNSFALNRLGLIYHYGINLKYSIKPDINKAIEYYQKSNTSSALYNLGLIYLNQEHNLMNDGASTSSLPLETTTKSIEYFKKSSAIGYSKASFKLGQIYHHGRDLIRPDIKQSKEYYKKASNQGNKRAKLNLLVISLSH